MTTAIVRRAVALGLGALWWWAVLRLLLVPGAGAAEGAVAIGGWGLSVLPVHCVPRSQAVGAVDAGRWRRALRTAVRPQDPARSSRGQRTGTAGPGERQDGSRSWTNTRRPGAAGRSTPSLPVRDRGSAVHDRTEGHDR